MTAGFVSTLSCLKACRIRVPGRSVTNDIRANEHGRALLAFEVSGDPERLIDEAHLLDNIAFWQPSDLPFAVSREFIRTRGNGCVDRKDLHPLRPEDPVPKGAGSRDSIRQ